MQCKHFSFSGFSDNAVIGKKLLSRQFLFYLVGKLCFITFLALSALLETFPSAVYL